ncbi:hypothetical protein ACOMHN_012066 [Nucella lapillus]
METNSSGYITVRSNLTEEDPIVVTTAIVVPAGHTVMVSFKETSSILAGVNLYGPSSWLWGRSAPESDFASVFVESEITVQVETKKCLRTNCFRLWFTFYQEHNFPALSPGVWNCSGDHYASFHHHLACNMKTECEDGRDETEHCPFSSADCEGRVALCDRCYSIVKPLPWPYDNSHQGGKEYCDSLGGALGIPTCGSDWYNALQSMKWIHPLNLCNLWTGLFVSDMSLPLLYRYLIIRGSKTVLYHAVESFYSVAAGVKECLVTDIWRSVVEPVKCSGMIKAGAFCEFQTNHTNSLPRLKAVSLSLSRFVSSADHQSVTVCDRSHHATYTFLLCGSNQYNLCGEDHQLTSRNPVPFFCRFDSNNEHVSLVPTYACSDKTTSFSMTMVCDFISDCQDGSDETFCKHPLCSTEFTCANGQCVPYDDVCNRIYHCLDKSDEENCRLVRTESVRMKSSHMLSPVLISFDDHRKLFVSSKMRSNESCPDSHFRCPGEFNDCLPVYTRCNNVHDCLDRQDEEDCEEITCPGFFRCRASPTCVHSDHLCDGWSHCPMHDDELVCDVTCPVGCLCQGHTFLCRQPFSAALFHHLRYLDATGSGMTLSDVSSNNYLVHLILAQCSLSLLPNLRLPNVRILDLGNNNVRQINMTSFVGFSNLLMLSLSNNPVTSICSSVFQHKTLTAVDLSFTALTVFDTEVFSSFPYVQKLNLTFTSLHTISSEGFRFMPQLNEVHLVGSPVKTYPPGLFRDLIHLRVISAGSYKFCCMENLPHNFDSSFCDAPRDEISSCEDLLQSWTYRGFLWLATCLSLTGNVFCFCARLFARGMRSSNAYSVFVTHLTIADFLMGVYIVIIGSADERFRGRYLHYDNTWKNSVTCKVAGFLSLLSSEVSAFIIWLITLDRFIVLRFPFSTVRFERTSASVACLLTWLVGWFLVLLPLLPLTSHWEFYSQTGMCIPLPVTRTQFKGRLYSFSVLIILNFVLFLLISAGQGFIYWSIQNNTLKMNSTKMSRDLTIARRLITVAVTDFMCWFPIGLCGVLAEIGVPVSGEINVALAVFVLPLNSAVNPFLYTFNTLAETRRKSKEAQFLAWLESHADVVTS